MIEKSINKRAPKLDSSNLDDSLDIIEIQLDTRNNKTKSRPQTIMRVGVVATVLASIYSVNVFAANGNELNTDQASAVDLTGDNLIDENGILTSPISTDIVSTSSVTSILIEESTSTSSSEPVTDSESPVETVSSTSSDSAIDPSASGINSVESTNVISTVESTSPQATNNPETIPPTTTTTPPLLGLNVGIGENDSDNVVNLQDNPSFTVQISNLDPITKYSRVQIGFINSWALGQIVSIDYNNCGNEGGDTGPKHIIKNAVIQPNESCTINYVVSLVDSGEDSSVTSSVKVSDITAGKSYTKQSSTLTLG